jgi:hypothetical protein
MGIWLVSGDECWRLFVAAERGLDAVKLGDLVKLVGSLENLVKLGGSLEDLVKLGGSLEDLVKLGGSLEDLVKLGGSLEDLVKLGRSLEDQVKFGDARKSSRVDYSSNHAPTKPTSLSRSPTTSSSESPVPPQAEANTSNFPEFPQADPQLKSPATATTLTSATLPLNFKRNECRDFEVAVGKCHSNDSRACVSTDKRLLGVCSVA